MMWNYRIIKKEEFDQVSYGIYEVYYKKDKVWLWSEKSDGPVADSKEDLVEMLIQMLSDSRQPVLEEKRKIKKGKTTCTLAEIDKEDKR